MTGSTGGPVVVADVARVLERHYPPRLAEAWDAVGLAVGSREAPVSRVLLAVDVTPEVLAEAVERGAELVVAHHPPFLRGLDGVDLDTPKGRLAADAVRAGVAVYVAHTNADVAPHGVVDALAAALGLSGTRPLRPAPGAALDTVVTFVPPDHLDAVVDALAAAGAGRLGGYDRCAFTVPGTGTFRPGPGATPHVGAVGEVAAVGEVRVEMVLPRADRSAVVAALLAAHPYETPAYAVTETAGPAGTDTGLGRVGELPGPLELAAFAERVRAALPPTAGGIRVAGDPRRPVRRVAVQAGAGDDLFAEVRRSGADVYVTSDLRHHPAAEALAWPDPPALVDVPHWAAEWTWLPVAARLLRAELDLPVEVSERRTDPWTARH